MLEKYSGRIVLSTCQMEAAMINDVVLEGIVVRAWKFAGDFFFRLACYCELELKSYSFINDRPLLERN